MPQIPQADATLLLGRDVSSYNILANMSEYLGSPKSISAKAFSYDKRRGLFCGSNTRFSKIVAAFLQISGTGCGILITFNSRSIALKFNEANKSFRYKNKKNLSTIFLTTITGQILSLTIVHWPASNDSPYLSRQGYIMHLQQLLVHQ